MLHIGLPRIYSVCSLEGARITVHNNSPKRLPPAGSLNKRAKSIWRLSVYLLVAYGGVRSVLTFGESVAATTREVEFHISQGPLAHALLQFSSQAGLPVSLDAGSANNLTTAGLSGRRTIGAALETLLKNSGLSYKIVGDTVTIIHIGAATNPLVPASSQLPSTDHLGNRANLNRP
jgi:hypothetical protein